MKIKLVPWGTDGRLPLSDLDLGSGHTAYRRASLIDVYLYTKFHSNQRNFLWTDGRTDIFSPSNIIRSTFGSQPKNQSPIGLTEIVLVFVRFLCLNFSFLFRFSFLDHYNSSSSSLKTTTDNSSSRFNFRNENYTGGEVRSSQVRLTFVNENVAVTAATWNGGARVGTAGCGCRGDGVATGNDVQLRQTDWRRVSTTRSLSYRRHS